MSSRDGKCQSGSGHGLCWRSPATQATGRQGGGHLLPEGLQGAAPAYELRGGLYFSGGKQPFRLGNRRLERKKCLKRNTSSLSARLAQGVSRPGPRWNSSFVPLVVAPCLVRAACLLFLLLNWESLGAGNGFIHFSALSALYKCSQDF